MHTHFDRGTTLYIKLKDGETVIDKFIDHKSNFVLLQSGRKIKIGDIAVITPRNLNLLDQTSQTKKAPSKKILWRKDQ